MAYRLLMVWLLLFSTACSESPPPAAPVTKVDTSNAEVVGADINWFGGSIEEAFATAKANNKPVFFYWGAIWCPPCQEIKNTVFKSSDFIALSKLFVPVYLDGDTPRAQAAGETFGVQGYPTMIVFNPAGEEVTRIPGGIDISRYNSVLESSLAKMRPIRELVQLAISDPASLSRDDFLQLAYYSWSQDFGALPEDAPETLFLDLATTAETVDKVASARLFMQHVVNAVRKNTEENPVRLTGLDTRLESILNDETLVLACWDSLAYWPESLEILDISESRRIELAGQWQERLLAQRHHPSLSTAEQLAGWLPTIYYHFEQEDAPLPADTAATLKDEIAVADRTTRNAFARQSVVNQINYLYQQAKMNDEARALLLAELDKSPAAYYFMSSLASLSEKEDKPDEAVAWHRRAWENSAGDATRFQWGASYVSALIRLQPEQHELITDTATSLLEELDGPDEMFTGRNFRVLRTLETRLNDWETESGGTTPGTSKFALQIGSLCQNAESSLARENCHRLASSATTAALGS